MKRKRKLLNREKNTIGPLFLLLGGILLAAVRIMWLIGRKVWH